MSRLNTLCAVILLITYVQFCNTEITIEDVDATTGTYNTQSSEEWFDPMKQKQNQTVEDVIRLLTPDVLAKIQKIIPEDNEETDEIEVEDSVEFSTVGTQDLNNSLNSAGEYETTDINNTESTTSKLSSTKLGHEMGDLLQLPIAAELSSNKQSKMFVSVQDTVAAPVSQIYSENTIYQGVAADQIGTANITYELTSVDESVVENQTVATTTTTTTSSTTPISILKAKKLARPMQTIKPKIYKYNAEAILQRFLNDSYIRKPMAALIDTSPDALRKTKSLWKSALRPNSPLDIVLVAFNSSGKNYFYFLSLN